MQESETENEIRYVLFRCGIIIQKEILVPYKKLFKVGDFMSDLDIIEKISIVIGCILHSYKKSIIVTIMHIMSLIQIPAMSVC